MRLLHAIHSMNPANGGTTEAVRILVKHVPATHAIATVDSPSDPWVAALGETSHALGPGRGSFGYSARYGGWLKANARNYDALIVHGLWQYPSVAARKAALNSGMPYFVYPHGMLDPWFKRADRLKHLKKCLAWPFADYRVMRDARAVLFTAEEEALLARDSFRPYRCVERVAGLGIPKPAGNAVELREVFLQKFPELRGRRIILFLGRIDPKKGLDLLVRAFGAVAAKDPWSLVLAGPFVDPAYHEHLKNIAEQITKPGAVVFTGMLTGSLKWGALHAADVFALPSHQENFGIAVAEALACRLPVLISNKVNIWREIHADRAGFIGNDDEAGTTETLRRWLALPEVDRDNMRGSAERCFARRYEIARAAEHLIDTLRAEGVPA